KQEGSAARHAAGGKPALQVCAAAWAVCVVLLAGGCYQIRPHVPPSEGHISRATERPARDESIPPPARLSEFVPPPAPAVKPQTYSVVVNEVPVKDLLLALARD